MRTDLSTMAIAAILMGSAFAATPAHAHIKLLKPASWLNEDDSGGPQKGGPCGPGGYDDVMPIPMSGMVSTFKPGEKVTVEWEVTIPHPGWYRIAFVKDRAELEDPDVEADLLCNVDHASVPTTPHGNVLADGLFMDSSESHFTYEVTMPDEPCDKCTLQLIQYMELHPPACIYYHCADIKIEGSSGNPSDSGTSTVTDAGLATDGGAAKDSGSTTSTHDAAVARDSSVEPAGDGDDDPEDEITKDAGRDSGTKKDAGTKRDAGSSENEDDEDSAEGQVASGGDDGCALAGSKGAGTSWLLLIFAALILWRCRAEKQ